MERHTKESVLELLSRSGVQFELHTHEPVMTAAAQAEALEHTGGAVTKNLFLRDKKGRQYLVTALPDTRVDLKVLSARLGLGSGNLSWAPPELLVSSLGVEPGCVTPLGLANAGSCGRVVALLDARLRGARRFCVHPIVNDASVLIDAAGLEAFLRAVGRQPTYVDLEAPKPQAPDLRHLADAVPPLQKGPPAAAAAAGAGAGLGDGSEAGSGGHGAAGGSTAGQAAANAATATDASDGGSRNGGLK
ncbi:hypothetical protein Rsub_11895 [Raphidocelis subcapitata]|uniref:YbaK/aminoacyl-tRNA synthetase-associated domain-containing protein n=1 Tax=Raphidocelis subcapitata TaxID=307507 RepID=A0A2V0PN80_9CHLO|nr:hypothetical protein Rsub_11895 [Raphidocelis subcapitata]|eukprot:GBF98565.1 hypothetical protein Rsub_11895 [Raphidocelis subcapitata]